MASQKQRSVLCGVVSAVLLAVVSAAVFAAERSPARASATAPADERTFTEQSIYIPYEKLRAVFEREGRGVFLPYEEFDKLWRIAREKTKPIVEAGPPVDALIAEASHEALVSRDVVQVKADLKIELLSKGWKEIPLHLIGSAITSASIGGQTARIVFDTNAGYKLLVEKKNDGSEVIDLKIEYVQAYSKALGQNSVTFQAPQAPVSRWTIRIPEPGVKVNIQPLIAATEIPSAETGAATKPAETVVRAFVGAAPAVRLDWTPKAEGATGLEALVSVQSEQQVTVEEGVTRTRADLRYEISRAELNQLVVSVPADQKIVNVLDSNVRQWTVAQADGKQQITVQLFEPARATQRVTVELERFHTEAARLEVTPPVVEAVGVGRQQGTLVVQVASGLRGEVTRHTGLLQIDAGELPASLGKTQWAFAYRFSAVPFDLRLQVEKIQPRIQVDSLVEVHLQPEQMTLDLLSVYTIEQAGVFQLELDVPPEYEIRQVRGREAAGAQPVQVDTYDRRGDDKSKVVINLSRKAMGRVALAVRFAKRLNEPDMITPTGHAASIALPLPRVSGTIERVTGHLVIHAPESLRVDTGKTEGLRAVSFAEAVASMGITADRRFEGARPVLAFAFGEERVGLTLTVERRKPQVTVRQLLTVSVDSGTAKYEATFYHDILYSGVKSLRIDIPAELAPDVRNTTQGVRERPIDPAPKDLREGYVAWSFSGETEFLGSTVIRLVWERKLDKLEVGKSVELTIPHLRPAQVDLAWGQIVLTKAEAMDVHEVGEPAGIRPIDPQHDLMAGARVTNAARAFEFHDDWTLRVAVARYKLEEVKRTSIERALVQMVVTRGGQTSVQALYRMRSAHQRLALKLPAKVEFDSEPLRLNGQRVPLERGEKDEFFIPLVGMNPDQTFLLELRYTMKDAGMRLDPPAFPSEPAIQKVYLCVFLPPEWTWLGSIGPWTDEMRWQCEGLDRQPVFPPWREGLAAWVAEGIQKPGPLGDKFESDGRMYLFSALRPVAPPDGSLRLITLDENWLGALVLLLILVPGALLLRARAPARWLATGIFIVVLIGLGIFFPTLSRQIVDGRLAAAVVVVAVLWLLHYVIWVRPCDPAVIARRQAIQEARLARIRARGAASVPAAAVGPQGDTSAAAETQKDEQGGANHA